MKVASDIASGLMPGDFIALNGELGSGKTVFVKGLAEGLGVREHLYVNSPTFVILKEYRGDIDLYHFDVYRLDYDHFVDSLDYRKYFYGEGVTVVEWADRIKDALPEEHLEVTIEHAGPDKRRMRFNPAGGRYIEIIGSLGEKHENTGI